MTTTTALRMGILSCADIADRRTAPAMLRAADIDLVAVAARDPERAKAFAERFSCAAEVGYQELLDRDDLDAVYLPVPTGLHAEWAERSLAAGKHVFVEKPMAATGGQARHITRLAAEGGLVLRENYAFLHHAQHREVRRVLAEGTIGRPVALTSDFGIPPRPREDIRSDPALGGGALLDLAGYPLSLARDLFEEELTVAGAVLRVSRDTGADVGGGALLTTASGVPVHMTFGFEHAYRSAYTVWGTRGRLVLDRPYTTPDGYRPVLRIERQDLTEERVLPADTPFVNALAAFARAVRAGDGRAGQEAGDESVCRAELIDRIAELAVRVEEGAS